MRKNVSECKKLRSLIKNWLGEKVKKKQKYDNFRIEYGDIVNESVTPKGDDVIDGVLVVYNSHKVPDKKVVKLQRE